MAKTKFEKAFEKMTPEQRRKTTEEIGNMMGMPPLPNQNKKQTAKRH